MMSSESHEPVAIPTGAAFVGSTSGSEYFWVGGTDWLEIPPLERIWFPTEETARAAGYRPASASFERLEEFELLGEVGRGGTSIVYLARDRALGREVAIKVIQASFLDDPENVARFAQEARLLAGLRHPNIVSAFSVKQLKSGGLALVMEYIRGPTLRDVLRTSAAMPIDRTDRVLRELAGALSAAHRTGIVHRDVKPDNVFLEEPTGRTLLADFGIATHLDSPTGLTMVGTAVGTPNYMSPEQIDGGPLDGRSDLYSLGLIGWEMLAGVKPWAAESLYSVIYKQKHEELPSVRELRPDAPLRLVFAIEGALAKDPADRWGSVDEFLASLSDDSLATKWRRWSALATQRRRTGREGVSPEALVASAESVRTVRFDRSQHGESASEAAPPIGAAGAGSPPLRWRRPVATAAAVVVGFAALAFGLRQPVTAPDLARASSVESARETAASDPVARVPFPTLPGTLADSAADVTEEETADPAVAEGDSIEAVTDTAPLALLGEPVESAPDAPPAAAPPPPTEAAPLLAVARSQSRVATGGMHSCGIDGSGGLVCWGGNDAGQLGGTAAGGAVFTALTSQGSIQAVEAGAFHTCALTSDGQAICWGENRDGQLGEREGGRAPAAIPNGRFASLALGSSHSCGLASDGSAYCWGGNAHGQLGDGSRAARSRAEPVATGTAMAVLAAGWDHTCGLTRQGEALCWGRNEGGQLGDGTTTSRASPVSVRGGQRFRSIAAGSAHTCALSTAGQAFCWGQNGDGRIGDGSTAQRTQPVAVGGSLRFAEISAGGRHTCALTSAGAAYCWGYNGYGQLGTGDTGNRSTPTRVSTDIVFTSLRSSGSHTCGTSSAGETYCWGYNVEGQVGDGSRTHRAVPQRVESSPVSG